MIVVDTNLIGYFFLSSDRSVQVERLFCKDPHWAAPLLWRSELRNVLVYYVRRKLLTLDDAHQIMSKATLLMSGKEYEVNSFRILSLAESSGCSAYDCEFVSLAQDLDIPLLTVDRQILAQFPKIAIPLEKFL